MGTLAAGIRRLGLRELIGDVLKGYERVDLLTYGSAIAFQIVFALIPLGLFGLGLLGFLGLQDAYQTHIVPELRDSTSPDVFRVLDSTVRKVLGGKQVWWITIGALVAVWEMSGAMRAVMAVLDRIYRCDRERGFRERYLVSCGLAVGCGALLLGAVAAVQFLPFYAGWPVTLALTVVAIAILLRFAPGDGHSWRLVSAGAVVVVVAWLGTSVVFGLYVTRVADYGSIFGNLATIIIVFEYFYLAACAFLTGALVDALLRERAR
jgi:membrane protein